MYFTVLEIVARDGKTESSDMAPDSDSYFPGIGRALLGLDSNRRRADIGRGVLHVGRDAYLQLETVVIDHFGRDVFVT